MNLRMPDFGISTFSTFGDLLKYLRRRAQLTQRELAIAVGYTEGHISRLEKNLRPPDLATVAALFVPALGLEEEPETAAQLMRLAANAHGDELPSGQYLTISRVHETTEISESAESIPSNLPIQLTTFIGRQGEIAEITALLSRASPARLVTLTGPGGIGKTRLALQTVIGLSHLYPDGIWFVDLAPLSSPELVPPTVASALSVAETRIQSIEETLIAYLRQKQILIVIDNCEHLISATAQLAEKLLRSWGHVQLLATSRELLKIPGEVNLRVPSLSLPEDEDGASQTVIGHEAVQLFIERARNTQPSLELTDSNASIITRICRQLDGMPLAIELAAARTSLLSLSQIEARLKDRFQLLSGGHTTLPRHQTLRATIEWSHDLLSEAEQILFRRLSVFAGGWTLDSANFVCPDDTNDVLDLLAGLVNKSMVVVERGADGEVRYRMLETIREYAGEQLQAADERERLRARHFDYFFQMAQQGEPRLFAPESFIDWAETEIDNLRAALAWALERDPHGAFSEERAGRALDLMLHVWPLWLNRGYSIEGNEWLNQLLSVHIAPTLARARALLLAGDFAGYRGDYSQQTTLIQEALALAQKLGDKKRIAWAWMEMGLIERNRHSPEAFEFLTESLAMFQDLKENLWVCRVSFLLAETYLTNGNLEAAKPLWKQGLDLCRKENDKFHIAWGLEGLGNVERLEGHLEQAREFYREGLKLKVVVMDKAGIFYSLSAFAQLAAAQKQFKRAAILWSSAEKLGQSLNLLLVPSKEGLYTSLMSAARARLGEEAFDAAWLEGKEMKMHEAIEYALRSSKE
jgi:predicted ATPase/transcriptional regulator with XRE-family HTH domain